MKLRPAGRATRIEPLEALHLDLARARRLRGSTPPGRISDILRIRSAATRHGVHRMHETLVVSSRGQITLPATLRKRLGIKGGDVMIIEDRGDEIVLKPGVVVELQLYGDEQVARWDAEDALSDEERTRILARLPASKAP